MLNQLLPNGNRDVFCHKSDQIDADADGKNDKSSTEIRQFHRGWVGKICRRVMTDGARIRLDLGLPRCVDDEAKLMHQQESVFV